jgi:hypothetical protein
MNPGSNPLPPLAAPETASVPADRPLFGQPGPLIPALNAALSGCAILTASDGVVIVEPLQFIGLSRTSGRLKADLPRFHHVHGGIDA